MKNANPIEPKSSPQRRDDVFNDYNPPNNEAERQSLTENKDALSKSSTYLVAYRRYARSLQPIIRPPRLLQLKPSCPLGEREAWPLDEPADREETTSSIPHSCQENPFLPRE